MMMSLDLVYDGSGVIQMMSRMIFVHNTNIEHYSERALYTSDGTVKDTRSIYILKVKKYSKIGGSNNG